MDKSNLPKLIAEALRHNLGDMFRAQKEIADRSIYSRKRKWPSQEPTGTLREHLIAAHFSVDERADGLTAHASWPIYIRFLDIKGLHINSGSRRRSKRYSKIFKFGGHEIYNRPLWGFGYSQTRKDVYAYIWEDYNELRKELIEAFNAIEQLKIHT